MSDPHNPYSRATDAYGAMAASVDPRALESKVLLKAAAQMEALAKRLQAGEKVKSPEIGEILDYNQKLWILFTDDACNDGHPLPQEIKNNIASLAIFVFKRSQDTLIEPTAAKLRVLIDINRNIAAGLSKRMAMPQQAGQDEARTTTDSAV